MQPQSQPTPVTKSGTSSSSSKTELSSEKKTEASFEALDFFNSAIKQPDLLEKDKDKVPYLETKRWVIEHFLKGPELANFEKVGFFLYLGVKVYEEGTYKEISSRKEVFA